MTANATTWQPGQSGNPSGRPKRKPITDAILSELASVARGGGTRAEAAAKKLVGMMFSRDPRVALEAAKLVLAYVEGMPTQTVELDVYDAARRLAEERGLDPDKVVSIFEGIRKRRAG